MKIYNFLLIIALVLIASCDSCEPNLEDQLNNGNSNPEALFISLYGADVSAAIRRFIPGGCQHPSAFTAEVDAMIFTADVDANGNITPNNQMYSQTTETLNLSSNAARTVQISVPENGGYYIMMIVSSDTCSDCCHGSLNLQCGIETSTSGNTTLCEAGNPSVIYMQGFSEQTRPVYNFDFNVSILDLMPWGCDCVCDVEC